MRNFGTAILLLALGATAIPARAQSVQELQDMTIEELAALEVTSASKRAEPLSHVAASIFVMTREDIRRSPATSLPELLRHVPSLHVQRVDARQFAVSARGFNGYETSNKLLALIDGRTIYTTLLSSIFWELHSPLLEDLQQVEVVSGPGGTLYGPNAVNGVINITSRPAGTPSAYLPARAQRQTSGRPAFAPASAWEGRQRCGSTAATPTGPTFRREQAERSTTATEAIS